MRAFWLAIAVAAGSVLLAGCDRDEAKLTVAAVSDTEAEDEDVQVEHPPLMAAIIPRDFELPVPKADPSPCPENMVLVEGDYCPDVKLNCKRWMDPPGRYEYFRCAEYGPSECKSAERVPMRFCIDRDEFTAEGENLPANFKSWTDANKTCKGLGKRVCMESEWNFACEGEEMRPYPYGWKRDPTACNADHFDIVDKNTGVLKDLRAPSDAYPRCESPFGVRNLAGNLEEFVSIDDTTPVRPAMKGAYWQPSRNFCRAAQTAHDRFYNGKETGFRCCADVD